MHKRPRGRPRKYHRSRPATNAELCRAYRQRWKQPAYLSSASVEWETPQDLFNYYDAIYHFTLDVCANPPQTRPKCARYFTPAQDGLAQDWGTEICWMNPPYGRGGVTDRWVRRAYEASKAGATGACLLKVATSSKRWKTYVLPYAKIDYLEKRLKFGGSPHNAPFDSAMVIFQPRG